jgi:hypothetical protein
LTDPNGRNGRDASGRFAKGNPGGPGPAFPRRVAELRAAILDAVTPADVIDVIRALVKAAKSGDVAAAKVFLDRVLGTPLAVDVLERIEELEDQLGVTT